MVKLILSMLFVFFVLLALASAQVTRSDVLQSRGVVLGATSGYTEYQVCNPSLSQITLSNTSIRGSIIQYAGLFNSVNLMINTTINTTVQSWIANISCSKVNGTQNATKFNTTTCSDSGKLKNISTISYDFKSMTNVNFSPSECRTIRYYMTYPPPFKRTLDIDQVPSIDILGNNFTYPEFIHFNITFNNRCSINISNPDNFSHLAEVIKLNITTKCNYLAYTSSLRIVLNSNDTEIPFQFQNSTNNSIFIDKSLNASENNTQIYLYFNSSYPLSPSNITFVKYYGFEQNDTHEWLGGANGTIGFRGNHSITNNTLAGSAILNMKPINADPFLFASYAVRVAGSNGWYADHEDITDGGNKDINRIIYAIGAGICGTGITNVITNASCSALGNLTHNVASQWKIVKWNWTADGAQYSQLIFNSTLPLDVFHNITSVSHTNIDQLQFTPEGTLQTIFVDEVYLSRQDVNQFINKSNYTFGGIEVSPGSNPRPNGTSINASGAELSQFRNVSLNVFWDCINGCVNYTVGTNMTGMITGNFKFPLALQDNPTYFVEQNQSNDQWYNATQAWDYTQLALPKNMTSYARFYCTALSATHVGANLTIGYDLPYNPTLNNTNITFRESIARYGSDPVTHVDASLLWFNKSSSLYQAANNCGIMPNEYNARGTMVQWNCSIPYAYAVNATNNTILFKINATTPAGVGTCVALDDAALDIFNINITIGNNTPYFLSANSTFNLTINLSSGDVSWNMTAIDSFAYPNSTLKQNFSIFVAAAIASNKRANINIIRTSPIVGAPRWGIRPIP